MNPENEVISTESIEKTMNRQARHKIIKIVGKQLAIVGSTAVVMYTVMKDK